MPKRIVFFFRLVLAGGFAMLIFLALWHRQIYSEDCTGESLFQLVRIGTLSDPRITESSGLAHWQHDVFLTHNDDTDSNLYAVNSNGKTVWSWELPFRNRDWEDLCTDRKGKVYLGDFGNNLNRSKQLKIHILDLEKKQPEGTIRFRYEEQTEFPPANPASWNFDCEAMVFYHDSLFLFTKNKNERSTWLYALPARPGSYTLQCIRKLPVLGMVTAAALRPDGKELALLTYGKVYFFNVVNGLKQIPDSDICLAWWKFRQSESLTYWGNDSLLAGNEQRELFLITRK